MIIVVGGGPFGLSTAVHLVEAGEDVLLIRPSSTENTSHNDHSRLYRCQAGKTGFWVEASGKSIESMKRRGIELNDVGYVGVSKGESPWREMQGNAACLNTPEIYKIRSQEGEDWKIFPQTENAGWFDAISWREKMEQRFISLGGKIKDGLVTQVVDAGDGAVQVDVEIKYVGERSLVRSEVTSRSNTRRGG